MLIAKIERRSKYILHYDVEYDKIFVFNIVIKTNIISKTLLENLSVIITWYFIILVNKLVCRIKVYNVYIHLGLI